ncbi:MAG: YceI family protein [Saprospiraceae bacterium]|nr:YceI family protein [Saprospiraceae bacterium]
MKQIKILTAFVAGIVFYSFLIHSLSCTREDAVIGDLDPFENEYSIDTVSDVSTKWDFDKSHSNVSWETPYKGVGSLLTGRFNTFNAQLEFIGDHPELTTMSGWVKLSSVNTSEPGRDTGCLRNTFGLTLGAKSDTAYFVSKKVELDRKGGYNVTADMTFHGFTKEVTMKLNYLGKTYFPNADATKSFWTQGFIGQFEFNALSDFGIVSTNIADRITVKMNILYRYYWNRP